MQSLLFIICILGTWKLPSTALGLQGTALNAHRMTSTRSMLLKMKNVDLEHTASYRVSNLARSIEFYEQVLGMKILQRDAKTNSVQLGYNDDSKSGIELLESGAIDKGDAFVGIGVTAIDAFSFVRKSEQFGGKIIRPFDEYGYGASIIPDENEMVINPVKYGCIEDPDGYLIEVTEGIRSEPLRKVILNVLDTEETVGFYIEKLGMNLLRRRSNINSRPKHASICSFVSYEDTEDKGTMIEFVYNYAVDRLNMGTELNHIALKNRRSSPIKGPLNDPNGYPLLIL